MFGCNNLEQRQMSIENSYIDTVYFDSDLSIICGIGAKDAYNKKQGMWIYFDVNGNVTTTCEYENGLYDGIYTSFSSEGHVVEQSYIKSGFDRSFKVYYNFLNGNSECISVNFPLKLLDTHCK